MPDKNGIPVNHQALPSLAEEILLFWFGSLQSEQPLYDQQRKQWFIKDPEFDQHIRDRFLISYEQAADGMLDDWQQQPLTCLALLLLLDQFPRNMFRQSPQAFATDFKAVSVAKAAIARGFDQALEPIQRVFMYLPLEHSENLNDQHQCVQLFQQLVTANSTLSDYLDYALKHYSVIEQFGRFPHRNQILDRPSTPEEIEFLEQPGSSF